MTRRRALRATLMIPTFGMLLLLSPGVPAPVINPGGGDGGGNACPDTDPNCWHSASGISGVVKDILLRGPGIDDVEAATSTGLYWSSDGRIFHPFPLLPPGTINSIAQRPLPHPPCYGSGECTRELFVATSSGVYRQQTSPKDTSWTPSFTPVLTGVSVSYVTSPWTSGTPGPVYANVTSPTGSRGLWRSADGTYGTWQRVLPDVEVRSLVVPYWCDTAADPLASHRVYVSTRCPGCTAENVGAIWMSTNSGLTGTWTAQPGPSKDIKDLVIVCNGAVSYRWMFAANGATTGTAVWRSLPTSTTLGSNFEPWSNGLPAGGANSFRGGQGHEMPDSLILATNSGLFRLPYNLDNRWVPYPTRGIASSLVNRWTSTYAGLEVATGGGVSFYWGPAPN